jgi:hypothetical protein
MDAPYCIIVYIKLYCTSKSARVLQREKKYCQIFIENKDMNSIYSCLCFITLSINFNNFYFIMSNTHNT